VAGAAFDTAICATATGIGAWPDRAATVIETAHATVATAISRRASK
jgi:hypothetical protein